MEKIDLGNSSDTSVTASAVVAAEINLPKFRTPTALLLGVTKHERRKRIFAA